MKHMNRMRLLTILMALALLATTALTACAEANAPSAVETALNWVRTSQASDNIETKPDFSGFEPKLPAAQPDALNDHVNVKANQMTADEYAQAWHRCIVYFDLGDNSAAQYGALLLIDGDAVIYVTDSDLFDQVYTYLSDNGDSDPLATINSITSLYMVDSSENTTAVGINAMAFSDSLPLVYLGVQLTESLDTMAPAPLDSGSMEVVGFCYDETNDDLFLSSDILEVGNGPTHALKSGTPYLYGSPVYSADLANSTYDYYPIGIQCSDGYIYDGYNALEELCTVLDSSAEQTGEESAATEDEGEAAEEETKGDATAIPAGSRNWIIGAAAVVLIAAILLRRRHKKTAKPAQAPAAPAAPQAPAKSDAPTAQSAEAAKETAPLQKTMVQKPEAAERKPSIAIRCLSGSLAGATFPLTGKVFIGRDPKRCGIIYPEGERIISAVHCSVEPMFKEQPCLILRDEGSTNGTFVNKKRLEAGHTACLGMNATFQLGGDANRYIVVID